MLSRLSIGSRVNSGFAISIFILLAFASFSYVSISNGSDKFQDYREKARQTLLMSEFKTDMFEARLAAFRFRIAPSVGAADEVHANVAEIVDASEERRKGKKSK